MERLPAIIAFASSSVILAFSFKSSNEFSLNNPMNGLFQNKCIEDLGCFYTGPPFYHPIHRPISVAPTSDLRTKFNIYTPSNPKIPQILNATNDSISNTILNANYPTKVIIHGYSTDLSENDARFMIKDELLREGPYNVIIVNWTENNKSPYYQAVANARVVGAQVAKLLNFHVEHRGFDPQNMHVIGHSLGGQMAGWVGERIFHLGRITGLDPAGPYFQDAEAPVRLDTSDADFVDIIHSNGGDTVIGGYGIDDPIGHVDFFPNGGRNQPGCRYKDLNATLRAVNSTSNFLVNSCSHGRAVGYFLASINFCQFLAVECSSYAKFRRLECTEENSPVAVMGFHAIKPENTDEENLFFLQTSDDVPYCLNENET